MNSSQNSTGGSGGGAAGGLLLLPLLLLAPLLLVLGTCLYPVAGVLTLTAIALVASLFNDGHTGFLVVLLIVLLPSFVIFVFGMVLEKKLQTFNAYRRLRHVLRIILIAFVAHVVALTFSGADRLPESTPFLDRISLIHVLIVLVTAVLAHFGSQALVRSGTPVEGFMNRFRFRRRAPP